jgi:catechol 2,3-dioxygenase-like lactoylglutathione lyase family enzyme
MRCASFVLLALVVQSFVIQGSGPMAAPVADEERVGIDLRRTTLIVSDIELSLKLYRDVLGFTVIYDNMIRTPRTAKTDAEADLARRLVFVRANDDYIGIIGLLQYTNPVKVPRKAEPIPFSPGSAVLLFTTEDLDKKFAAVREIPGIEILQEPVDVTYPPYAGGNAIEVRTSSFYDPDGFLVELNSFPQELPDYFQYEAGE